MTNTSQIKIDLLQRAYSIVNNCVVIINLLGAIKYINPSCETYLNTKNKKLENKHISNIIKKIILVNSNKTIFSEDSTVQNYININNEKANIILQNQTSFIANISTTNISVSEKNNFFILSFNPSSELKTHTNIIPKDNNKLQLNLQNEENIVIITDNKFKILMIEPNINSSSKKYQHLINNYLYYIFVENKQLSDFFTHRNITDEFIDFNKNFQINNKNFYLSINSVNETYSSDLKAIVEIKRTDIKKLSIKHEENFKYKNFFTKLQFPVIIITIKKDAESSIISDCNKSFCETEFKSKSKIIGQKLIEVYKKTNANNLFSTINTLFTDKYSFKTQHSSTITDSLFEKSYYLYKLSSNEIAIIFYNISSNINEDTSFRKAEQHYKMLIDNSSAGFIQFNEDGIITDCNDEFVKIMGSSKNALIGFNLLKSIKNTGVLSAIKKALNKEVGIFEGEYTSITGNKKSYVRTIFTPVCNQNKSFIAGIGSIEDISNQKNAENKLKHNEAKLKTIYENASDSILIFDTEGKIVSINKTLSELTGYSLDNLIQKNINYLFPNYKLNFIKTNNEETNIKECYIKTKYDKKVHIEINSKMIYKNHYISIIRNLTERDITLTQLKEAEERTSALLKAFPDLILVLDKEFNLLEYHSATSNITNFTSTPELDITIHDFLPNNIIEKFQLNIKKLIEANKPQLYEFQIKTNDKEEIFEAKFVLLGKDKILSVIRNITDRKTSEKQNLILSKVVEQSSASIFITDTNGIFEYTNPAFTHLSEYTTSDIEGQTPDILRSNKHSEMFHNKLWATILSGKTWKGEIQNKTKSGKSYWVNSTISPIFDENGKILHFFAINEDITDKKEILAELTKSKELAEKSDRLKTVFLQNMSHEIRTPLNGILGFAGLINDEENDLETIKEYSKIIQESGTRLLDIVNNLIEISKIETGNIQIDKHNFSINNLIKEIHNVFLINTEVKGLNFDYEIDKNIELINTDKDIVKQIFTHLIDNAIKYTKFGHIKFGYKIVNKELIFFVKDSGIGLNKDQIKFVFERFYKAENTNNIGIQGTGIGLSIVKAFINLLEGDIWIESIPNKGSIFYFKIKNILKTNNTIKNIDITKKANTPNTLLIAEDDTTSYIFLESILSDTFKHIIHAKNGKEAIELVKSRDDISTILMDIRMPIMDGIEATREIKRTNPDIQIIVQTAYAFSNDKEKIINAGCDFFITKPVDRTKLLNTLNKLMN